MGKNYTNGILMDFVKLQELIINWNKTFELEPEPVNDGVAEIKITGSLEVGGTLGIQIITDDDDGNGTLLTGGDSYQWYSNNQIIFGAINSLYTLGSKYQGSKIKVRVDYTDGEGNNESIFSSEVEIALIPEPEPEIIYYWTELGIISLEQAGLPEEQIPEVNSILNNEQINNLIILTELNVEQVYEYLLDYNLISDQIQESEPDYKPEPNPEPADTNKTYYWTEEGLQALIGLEVPQDQIPELNSILTEEQVNNFILATGFTLDEVYQYLVDYNLVTDQI